MVVKREGEKDLGEVGLIYLRKKKKPREKMVCMCV
jgi:hypothetical protein